MIQWISPTVQITKTTSASAAGSHTFSFAHAGLQTLAGAAAASSTLAVTGVGSATGPQFVGPIGSAQTITETPPAGYSTVSITCTDANAASNGNTNPVALSTTLGVNSITIAAAAMKGGSDVASQAAAITCTFVNTEQPTLTKAFSPASISVGGASTLTFTLTNPAGGAATPANALAFTDTLPAGLVLAAAPVAAQCTGNVAGAAGGNTITFTNGELMAGTSCTVTASVTTAPAPTIGACPQASNTNAAANITASAGLVNNVGSQCLTVTPPAPTVTLVAAVSAATTTTAASPFGFGSPSGFATDPSSAISVPAGTGGSATGAIAGIGAAGTAVTISQSSVAAGFFSIPDSVVCLDSNFAVSGNVATNLNSTLDTATATLPASVMKASATIACTFTNSKPSVTLNHVTAGLQTDNALFNLTVSGTSATGGTNPANGVGNGGSTGAVTVNAGGAVSLTETAGFYTDLSNYNSALSCVDAGGAAVALASGGTTSGTMAATAAGLAASTPVGHARKMICTFTNTSKLNALPAAPTLSCSAGGQAFDTGRFSTVNAGKDDRWKVAVLNSSVQAVQAPPASGYFPASLVWSGATTGTSVISGVPSALASARNNSWYRFDFNLDPAADPATVALSMKYWADNEVVSLWVNGVQQSVAGIPTCGLDYVGCNGYSAAGGRTATLASNWQAGANSLVVQVGDGGGSTYFYTNFQTAALCRPKLTITQDTQGGFGGPFTFAGTAPDANGWVTPPGLSTTAAGAAGRVSTAPQILTAASTQTVLSETSPAGYALGSVACTGTSNNVQPAFTAAGVITLPAAALNTLLAPAGLDVACTVTSSNFPTVKIVKTTTSGTGSHTFSFALGGLSAGTETITVAGAATVSGPASLSGTSGTAVTITETSPAGWPANPVSASCVDASSATPLATFGTLSGATLSIPAAKMVAGAAITCTFTNRFGQAVSGKAFTDNGAGGGTANDGIANGGEAGIAGVSVRLTNCASTTLASASTDASGAYSLAVPVGTAAGTSLCVLQTSPGTRLSTGASVGGAALPSGSVYSYTRGATPERIAFAWNGDGHAGLNFGTVEPNTFAVGGAKSAMAGNTVSYAHTFTAQSAGSVRFSVASAVASPALGGWSESIHADAGCTGALQAGAALLYPPAVASATTAGQPVCIIVQEFIPATAPTGYSNTATVQADFTYTNASPALSASYTVTDITTLSGSALELKKEVRNVTAAGSFGLNNEARSGDTLEYRITYTNNGTTPISALNIADVTPNFTRYVDALAGTTPATLSACSKTTPAGTAACATPQAPGGTGAVKFNFTGPLHPGATGSVLFQVKID